MKLAKSSLKKWQGSEISNYFTIQIFVNMFFVVDLGHPREGRYTTSSSTTAVFSKGPR